MPKWEDTRKRAEEIHRARGTQVDEEHRAQLREGMRNKVRAYRLAEIREAQELTQTEVARAMGTTQSNVSRFERGELGRSELATIAAYVEALGGSLRLVADFGDRQVQVG